MHQYNHTTPYACCCHPCPGCLQASATRGPGEPAPQLAGRAWLAEYARGCGNELFVIRAGAGLDGVPWLDAVIAAFRQQHVLLIGKAWPDAPQAHQAALAKLAAWIVRGSWIVFYFVMMPSVAYPPPLPSKSGVNHDRPQGGRRRGGGCLSLNPSKHVISRGEQLLVIASSRRRAEAISGLSESCDLPCKGCSSTNRARAGRGGAEQHARMDLLAQS